jgi:hypothetical protein
LIDRSKLAEMNNPPTPPQHSTLKRLDARRAQRQRDLERRHQAVEAQRAPQESSITFLAEFDQDLARIQATLVSDQTMFDECEWF